MKQQNRTANIQIAVRLNPEEAAILRAAADAASTPFAEVSIGRYMLVKALEAARREAKGQREKAGK